jgi:HK97 family phage prohead protease
MEILTAPFETKDVGTEGGFSGNASVFGVKDLAGDVIEPGAFRKSLSKGPSRVKMLWSHNPSEPIGVWTELREDSRGLYAKGQLLLSVQRAKETHSLLKARVLDGLSIGFRTSPGDTDYDANTRTLKSIDL